MPSAVSINVVRQICNVIKRFKFEELEVAVMPHIRETSWKTIREELVKARKTFTVNNVVQIIEKVLIESKLQDKVLQDRLSTLEVIDISRHDKRRIWYGYVMSGPGNMNTRLMKKRKMLETIKGRFESLDKQMDVKIETYNSVTYVSVKEVKKKKSAIQRTMPLFFALFLNQKHFFCTRGNVSNDVMKAMAVSLGYADSKRLTLTGRDVRSLDKLYRRKQQGANDIYDLGDPPVYTDSSPIIKCSGVDFTQQRQRRKYAEKCFGDEPLNLELLVLKTKDQPWIDEDLSTKLKNETMGMTWELRSPNIASYLTKLIERRIVVSPAPSYISNLMKLGKNELTITRT